MYFERPKDHNVKYNFPYIKLLDKDSMPRDIERQKIEVVDFYSSYCGICFKKFPEYERLKQKYNSDTNVKFYAIHVGYEKDTFSNSIKLLDGYSYTFNKLYSISRNEIRDSLGFESFPQLFIIKNGQIIHHGFLETNPNILLDNTDEIIQTHLKDISSKTAHLKGIQH